MNFNHYVEIREKPAFLFPEMQRARRSDDISSFNMTRQALCYFMHSIDQETEAQEGRVACPSLCKESRVEWGLNQVV